MAKRKFRIEAGRYGGEVAIGKVNADFVDHFINPEDGDGDLIDYVTSFDWDEVDESIPVPYENFESWTETTDIEHLNGAYADGQWTYEEVPADGSDDYAYENVVDFDAYHLYGREAYIDDKKPEDMTDYKPVLQFHSGEKGGFGSWFVETDGEDFNPKKVAFSSVETQVAEIVQDLWYDKELIDQDYDNCDTTGKGYYAQVGYMNMKWHDTDDKYTEEYFTENEIWEYYDDEVAEEKKERATTVPLNISVNEIVGEVGTIDNPGAVDANIEPITEPPVVSVDEAETYKDLQDSLTNLNSDDNSGLGEEGEEL